MEKTLRILIVEDSAVVGMLLKALLASEPDMEVVGVARDGREGVELARSLRPDLITMDIRMPVMDGFLATREIMATCATPIVVISSSVDAEELRITFRAIEEGALSVLEKPHGLGHPDFERERQRIVETVRAMAEVKVVRRNGTANGSRAAGASYAPPPVGPYEVVGIGASTGGPQALHALLGGLPANFPLPIVVVQHICPGFIHGMTSWLDSAGPLRVAVAEEGQRPAPGEVLFARDGVHMTLVRGADGALAVHYLEGEPEGYQIPAVNVLLRSLAEVSGVRAIGGVLTGMGEDGAAGLLALRRRGGLTFAQAPESCVVAGMPQSAIVLGAAAHTPDLGELARFLGEAGGRRMP